MLGYQKGMVNLALNKVVKSGYFSKIVKKKSY